ncbi:MAG TPA: NAD(P)H nitroreductase, partial [Phycisphaerae bacterium]|nr:NAD(P)H nitroreductase [Phycisphaerae bacterium]
MEYYDVVKKRRSVRKFTDESVPRESLERIAQAGLDAPSGLNLQNRHFVIVDDPEVLARMRHMTGSMATSPAVIV